MTPIENTLEANFVPVEGDAAVAEQKGNADRSAKMAAMKAAFKRASESDSSFLKRVRSLSDKIEVVKTLAFGNKGGIVVARDADGNKLSAKGDRALEPTGAIVGYLFKNNSDQTLVYTTEDWELGADGIYVSSGAVQRQAAPGQTFMLNRKYTTMMAAEPEISFTFANGKLVSGSGAYNTDNLDKILNGHYFKFAKELDINVHGDEVKVDMSTPDPTDPTKLKVKPEYAGTFGYLQNPPVKAGRAGKAATQAATMQEKAAAYVREKIMGNLK